MAECGSTAVAPGFADDVSDLIDTSVIVRYRTGDPPHLANLCVRLIDGETALVITDVVLLESAYVPSSVYDVPRERWSPNSLRCCAEQTSALSRRGRSR